MQPLCHCGWGWPTGRPPCPSLHTTPLSNPLFDNYLLCCLDLGWGHHTYITDMKTLATRVHPPPISFIDHHNSQTLKILRISGRQDELTKRLSALDIVLWLQLRAAPEEIWSQTFLIWSVMTQRVSLASQECPLTLRVFFTKCYGFVNCKCKCSCKWFTEHSSPLPGCLIIPSHSS